MSGTWKNEYTDKLRSPEEAVRLVKSGDTVFVGSTTSVANALCEALEQRLDDPISPKVMSRMNEDGSFATPSLEDMAPFISKEEHDALMLWD